MALKKIAVNKKSFRVAHLGIADHLTLGVAAEREAVGFKFSRLEPVRLSSWKQVQQELAAGRVDAAFVLAPLAILLRSQGVQIKVVLLGHREGVVLTVGKNSGINSPKDLRGKTIGVPHEYSTHRLLLHELLKKAGLSEADVREKRLVQLEFKSALADGSVDAFISAEPFASLAEEAGVGRALAFSSEIMAHHVDCVLCVRQEFLQTRREAVQELVEALVRSAVFIHENPVQASAIAERFMGHGVSQLSRFVSLDGVDLQLLSLLSRNGRLPTALLARELGISPSAVAYRLEKLVSSRVIKSFELELGAGELGAQEIKLLFSLRPRDEAEVKRMIGFLRSRPQVARVTRLVGEFSLEATVFVRSVQEVDSLARGLAEKFAGCVKSYEPLLVYQEFWRSAPA